MPSITRRRFVGATAAFAGFGLLSRIEADEPRPLAGTEPLTLEGDLSLKMVDGLHKYLDRALADAPKQRQKLWKLDTSSPEAYAKSVEPHRDRLRKIIGAVDERKKPVTMEFISSSTPIQPNPGAPVFPPKEPLAIAKGDGYSVYAVRWPVFDGLDGEGLLLQPDKEPKARVVAIPDADQSPEMLVGMAPGVKEENQFARGLAEQGCQVLMPVLIDRKDTWSGSAKLGRMTNQPHREFIYRMAYEMGRHIIGYEVQRVLAGVDWLHQQNSPPKKALMVWGYGEGGLIGLYASALDSRIDGFGAEGFYYSPGPDLWEEPIYRSVWGLLSEFGLAELTLLMGYRSIEWDSWPNDLVEIKGPPPARDGRSGAAPGRLTGKENFDSFLWEISGAKRAYGLKEFPLGEKEKSLREKLGISSDLAPKRRPPADTRKDFDPAVRLKRQFDQLVTFTQRLVQLSPDRRQEFFWNKVQPTGGLAPPARLEQFEKACEPLRKYFDEEVIGKAPEPSLPANPQTRLLFDEPKWKGYEVVLDLYPDVYAYGILTVPKDLASGGSNPPGKRPVVVCQHGLEGRPRDVVSPKTKTQYYNSFGSALADRGFVVFAPQNPYIGKNDFRQLQRKANPLKVSLFSFIVRQHERILDWLAGLPFVDPARIGFYGLSYGGKTAMRVPAILKRYCLSICSGDFNEWIWKNTSVDWRGSYMFTGEYEMFEFDLGHTFNYAEMAGLIAPRPFMVERGHDDGVGIDEWVAFEYAKVRRLYAKLGIPERTAIEFFNGGHVINGQGTFAFLHKHLNWPAPSQ